IPPQLWARAIGPLLPVNKTALTPPPCRSSGRRRRIFPAHHRSGVEHRTDDLVVAGAAAQIAGEPIAGLFLGRVLVLIEQRLRRDDKARGAKAALQRGVLEKFLLHR